MGYELVKNCEKWTRAQKELAPNDNCFVYVSAKNKRAIKNNMTKITYLNFNVTKGEEFKSK